MMDVFRAVHGERREGYFVSYEPGAGVFVTRRDDGRTDLVPADCVHSRSSSSPSAAPCSAIACP
jgi:hypothetical protein